MVLRFHSQNKLPPWYNWQNVDIKTINETNPISSRLVFSYSRCAYFLILSMMPLILQNEDSGTDIQKGVMIASSKCENKNEDIKRCNESWPQLHILCRFFPLNGRFKFNEHKTIFARFSVYWRSIQMVTLYTSLIDPPGDIWCVWEHMTKTKLSSTSQSHLYFLTDSDFLFQKSMQNVQAARHSPTTDFHIIYDLDCQFLFIAPSVLSNVYCNSWKYVNKYLIQFNST